MPIDYKKYPKDWKTKIRPDILKRAENRCEFCKIPNGFICLRGKVNGLPVYQDFDGNIYDAENSKCIGDGYLGDIDDCNKGTQIVLTIAHLDHNIKNNDYSNLKALCQRCHLNHDRGLHTKNSNKTRRNKKQNYELF